MQTVPVRFADVHDRFVQILASQLFSEWRTDALVSLLQRSFQTDGCDFEALLPTLKGFVVQRRLTLKRWWRRVGVASSDGANSGLMVADLPSESDHNALLVEQKKIAVPTHQLEHEDPLDGLARAMGQSKLHHPLETVLLKLNQRHLPQAVLHLLREGASRS